MAIRTKIEISKFAQDESIRIDFNYINYLNKTKTNSKLSNFIYNEEMAKIEHPDEFDYVEIGDLNSKGEITPNSINLNIRNFDNEDVIKKIENGNIQSVVKNDILLSSVRPNLKKILLIDDSNKHLYFTKAFHKIRSKINPKLTFYLLKYVYFNTLNCIARMGKGYPTLKIDDLLEAKIDDSNFSKFIKNEKKIIERVEFLENKIFKISKKLIDEDAVINKLFEKTYNYDFNKIYKKYFKLNYKINFYDLNSSNDLRLGFKYRNPLRNELLSLCSTFSSNTIDKYIKIPIKLGQTLTEDNIDATTDKHYISMANIKSLYLNTDETAKISEDFYEEFKDVNSTRLDDILLARSGEGTIGKVAVVDQKIEGLFADFLMRIRLDNYPSNYAYYFFRTKIFQELINLTKKGLGNNTNIYPSDISQLPIPDLDNKLKKCCDEITKIIKVNKSMNNEIVNLRGKILDYINNL